MNKNYQITINSQLLQDLLGATMAAAASAHQYANSEAGTAREAYFNQVAQRYHQAGKDLLQLIKTSKGNQ